MKNTSFLVQNKLKRTGIILGILFAIFIVVYIFFRSLDFIQGPSLYLNEPKDGAVYKTSLIDVSGVVKNVSNIDLNGKQISINKNGFFNEKYILANGLNKILFTITDRFDRKTEKIVNIILKPQIDSSTTELRSGYEAGADKTQIYPAKGGVNTDF
ncbi:MAG: hypothetical protein WC849_02505 [Candidatus Paceibacterota bacterium]